MQTSEVVIEARRIARVGKRPEQLRVKMIRDPEFARTRTSRPQSSPRPTTERAK
jgi:hypothetical protein